MERISLTIDEKLLKRVDEFALFFAKGDLNNNRSAYICDILDKYVPTIE